MSGAALDDGTRTWSASELDAAVSDFAGVLRGAGVRVLATLLDNSVAWVVAERAEALRPSAEAPSGTLAALMKVRLFMILFRLGE